MFGSLTGKLVALLTGICVALGIMFAVMLRSSHETYHLQVSQGINKPLAGQLVGDGTALAAGALDANTLAAKLARLTEINPHIAVYLLDETGVVVGSSEAAERVKARRVDLAPVRRLLDDADRLPVLGTDPADPARPKIFSVAELTRDDGRRGFLYVVLRGEEHEANAATLRSAYTLREGMWLIASGVAFAILAGWLMVNLLTRPLHRLATAMDRFRANGFREVPQFDPPPLLSARDEVGRLGQTFNQMAMRMVGQLDELRKSDASRREFFANVSHDLRTPLASLLGYLETVATTRDLTAEEQREYCKIATQEAGHLSKLVDRLFELAKLDAPEAKTSPEPFRISEVAEAISRKFALVTGERGIRLATTISEPLPLVHADRALVERALENLVENALRYTPSGGIVTITATLDHRSGQVAVQVSDTGVGIPEESLPHIFDRFFRGEQGRGGQADCAGLGLAIVKRIVELHGSVISVESAPGRGTVFRFRLQTAKLQPVQVPSRSTCDPRIRSSQP